MPNANVNVNVGKLSTGVASAGANAAIGAGGDKMPLFIVIGVTVFLFVAVILYITFRMKGNNLQGRALTSVPIRLDKLESPVEVAGADIPKPSVGREFSYAFWLYVDNFVQEYNNAGQHPWHKMIFYRGNAGDVSTANPVVMMDGQSNKLYIVIKTEGSTLKGNAAAGSNVNTNLNDILLNNYFLNPEKKETHTDTNKHVVMAIDYIPLQRWVHVGVVVDNKLVTIYVDGEIYSVKSVDEFKGSRALSVDFQGRTLDYNLILDKSEGNIYIGKGLVGDKRAPNGFMGKLEYFNYALGSEDVKKAYASGPIKGSWLSMFGMSQYGVRSPVYKLSESVQS